ncbi:M12 family metallo-peptidase [Pinibacter aurantiacus]|uniref:Fibronectin type III domain-containing protein n=1 Tax=Pinibacter aurantiacus TaxID=2851599 RepID=A0A9E2SBP2_9BACT|nr:M12 family metallo-peptidase [Pinibacter aurantiacus]MBV4358539.1 fibronectin type III domain-containing protein [Pinibacter aurantiacus]
MPAKHFLKGSLLFLLVVIQISLFAQNKQPSRLYQMVQSRQQKLSQKGSLPKMSLFQKALPIQQLNRIIPDSIISKRTILSLNGNLQSTLLRSNSELVKLEIPTVERSFDLVLMKQEISPVNKSVLPALKRTGKSVHYRGYVDGDPNSLAAFSVFEDGSVVGLFLNKTGNYVLTKLKNSDQYIVYNDADLKIKEPFTCLTKDDEVTPTAGGKISGAGVPSVTSLGETQCRKVKCYWETDDHTYQNFDNDYTATENFVLALFNEVAALYQNEGIVMELSAYKIWTTQDPYGSDDTYIALTDFKTNWNNQNNSFDGDLAFLICGRNGDGLGYVGGLCNRQYAYGAFGMNPKNVVPWQTYSWNVMATSHELGHLLGSNHTQWCGWKTGPGNTCGAIDNCAATEGATDCPTCSYTIFNNADPVDAWHGTIMSYCHLQPRGILMINGFGQIPGDFIRGNVSRAACLEQIGVCPCEPPVGLTAFGTSDPDLSQITCRWTPNANADYYFLEYKKVSDPDWMVMQPILTNEYTFFIEAGTNYVYRVESHCPTGISTKSEEYQFSLPCSTPYLISVLNISSTSVLVTWKGFSGAKTFTLEYKKASDNVWISIDGIAEGSQLLSNLEANTQYNYRMKKQCNDYESTYTDVGTFTTTCQPPTLPGEFISGNTVLLFWTAAPQNPSYVIEYRKTNETDWTTVNTAEKATSQVIANFQAGEEYVYRIKAKCAEGFYSDYTAERTFSIACAAPTSVTSDPKEDNASVIWNSMGAQSYDFQYRKTGDNSWISSNVTDARINLTNLRKGTVYEFGIFSQCRLVKSTTSLQGTFRTLGEPLPLSLTDFEGSHVGNDNVLRWSTHDEVNTSKFEIEYSADNTSYQLAGTVAAAGTSNSSLQYHFTHSNVSIDAYYRLKMIDIDGSFTYSNTILIKGNNDQRACVLLNDAVYPIPFEDKFTMNIYSCTLQTAKIILRSIDGKLLRNETVTLKKGTASYELNQLGSLSSGSYSLQIIPQKGEVIVRKVVKR